MGCPTHKYIFFFFYHHHFFMYCDKWLVTIKGPTTYQLVYKVIILVLSFFNSTTSLQLQDGFFNYKYCQKKVLQQKGR